MTPTVDVIVPCFNYGRLLTDCVRSVLDQEGVSVRVLIMDDASTDNTEGVGRRLGEDPRVEFRRHAMNRGHIATYNEALALVTANYVVLLSADDMLTPGALARATRLMDADSRIGVVYGRDIPFRDRTPLPAPRVGAAAPLMFEYGDFLRAACRLGHTGIQAPTVVVRTDGASCDRQLPAGAAAQRRYRNLVADGRRIDGGRTRRRSGVPPAAYVEHEPWLYAVAAAARAGARLRHSFRSSAAACGPGGPARGRAADHRGSGGMERGSRLRP